MQRFNKQDTKNANRIRTGLLLLFILVAVIDAHWYTGVARKETLGANSIAALWLMTYCLAAYTAVWAGLWVYESTKGLGRSLFTMWAVLFFGGDLWVHFSYRFWVMHPNYFGDHAILVMLVMAVWLFWQDFPRIWMQAAKIWQ